MHITDQELALLLDLVHDRMEDPAYCDSARENRDLFMRLRKLWLVNRIETRYELTPTTEATCAAPSP